MNYKQQPIDKPVLQKNEKGDIIDTPKILSPYQIPNDEVLSTDIDPTNPPDEIVKIIGTDNAYKSLKIDVPNIGPTIGLLPPPLDEEGQLKFSTIHTNDGLNKNIPFYTPGTQQRIEHQNKSQYKSIKDAREILNDNAIMPAGIFFAQPNAKTGMIETFPAVIQESQPQVLPKPIGPIRTTENTLKREQVSDMYNIDRDGMSNYLGSDSLGNRMYSDGNSYLERLIFTGYDRSFLQPKVPYYEVSHSKDPYGNTLQDLIVKNRTDKTMLISKSGYYYTSTAPIKSLFLGYNDDNILPSGIPMFWTSPREYGDSGTSNRYFYNDEISSKELKFFKRKSSYKDYKYANLINGDYLDESIFWSKNIYSKFFDEKDNIVDYNTLKNLVTKNGLHAVPVVPPGTNIPFKVTSEATYDTNPYGEGTYREMIFNLAKHDLVELTVYNSLDVSPTISSANMTNKPIVKPTIVRRSEQYGPNPLQHLYYMDFFDWRKYTTTYILKRSPGPQFKYTFNPELPLASLPPIFITGAEPNFVTILGFPIVSETTGFYYLQDINSGQLYGIEKTQYNSMGGNQLRKQTIEFQSDIRDNLTWNSFGNRLVYNLGRTTFSTAISPALFPRITLLLP